MATEKGNIVFGSMTNGEFASCGGTETLMTWRLSTITRRSYGQG